MKERPSRRDNCIVETAKQHVDAMHQMEMKCEELFESLQDSKTIIQKQAAKCLKTNKQFKS